MEYFSYIQDLEVGQRRNFFPSFPEARRIGIIYPGGMPSLF